MMAASPESEKKSKILYKVVITGGMLSGGEVSLRRKKTFLQGHVLARQLLLHV